MEKGYARRLLLFVSLAWLLPMMIFCGQSRLAASPPAYPPPTMSDRIRPLLRFTEQIPRVHQRNTPILKKPIGWPGNFERFSANIALFRLINTHRHPWLDGFCLLLLYLGSGYIVVPITILTGFFRRERLWMLLAAVAIESLLVTVMKPLFMQPRPGGFLPDVFMAEELSRRSFPSGDAAMAFTLAWVLKSGLPWPARAAFIFYAVAVAYERIYFGAHFPLDVLAGAAVGILSVMLTERLFKRKTAEKPVEEPTKLEAEEVPV